MRTLKLTIAYDGTGFCGWQIQPNGPSIQQALTDSIEKVTGVASRPTGSGRTDAGVHALAQVAHFKTESTLAPEVLKRAINAYLPEQIVITDVVAAADEFDAQRDAQRKHYRYVYHDGVDPDVFRRLYCWKLHGRLNEQAMLVAARLLEGTHDFAAFETEWPNRASSVRTIHFCRITRSLDFVYLDVQADGFLYNMVRCIAGSLYAVGRGKWQPDRVGEILRGRDRTLAGQTAPAQGLFLVKVEY